MVEPNGQEPVLPAWANSVSPAAPSAGVGSEGHPLARLSSWLPRVSPTALGYLMGPVSLATVLLLTRFGVLLYEPPWLWIAVFAAIPLTSALVDHLYRLQPSRRRLHLLVAQNVAAATTVIYLSGWGPVMVLAFAFVALGNIARGGSRAWRIAALWSLVGISVGQVAIWQDRVPSVLSDSRAQVLGFLGAFVLFFVIRLAGAVMQKKEEAEKSVSQSEARLRRTIDTTNEAYLEFDDRCVITEWNEQAVRTFGWSREEALGRELNELVVVPSNRAGFNWESVHRVAEGSPGNLRAQVESFALHRDGHEFPVQVSLWQTDTDEGSRFNAFIEDITERTKATEDLQRSQESFRLLFEKHPHPMWVYDFETLAFLEVNQCATENYGFTREEFLSMSITEIRPEDEIPRLLAYQQLMHSDLTHAGVWRHRIKSGEIISVEIATHTLEFNGRPAALVMAQDVTERCRLEQQLHDHALHDALTGLPNRSLLLDRLDRLNAQATRSDADATVICLNLDNFKMANDVYGYDVGDRLLRAVGQRLVGGLREVDTVGRMGGDEFVLLAMPPVTDPKPELMAQRVLDLISSLPFHVDGHELRMTASVGISTGRGRGGSELIQNADIALSLAREAGGNSFVVFAQAMQTAVTERHRLAKDLRDAVTFDQFEAFYQPVMKLRDRSIIGVEALVRWRHPTLGLIPPARFIPLAEELGIIGDIGRIVLGQACRLAAGWQRTHKGLTVAVNVSVFQLRSDDFADSVTSALETNKLDPGCLVLEITESILINDAETSLKRLRALKEIGVRLAIDDFGSGYSSLSYLEHFPFDILKIDQSFVDAIVDSPKAVEMVRTIIQLGRRLKLEVIAEGVETEQQLEILLRLHGPEAQGYLFSRPLEVAAMERFLHEHCLSGPPPGRRSPDASRGAPPGLVPVSAFS